MKEYLGDAVYVDFQRDMLVLTTEDGRTISNTIWLEGQVWKALLNYVKRINQNERVSDRNSTE